LKFGGGGGVFLKKRLTKKGLFPKNKVKPSFFLGAKNNFFPFSPQFFLWFLLKWGGGGEILSTKRVASKAMFRENQLIAMFYLRA